MLTSDEAAKLLIDIVFNFVYKNLIRDMETIHLPEGMPGWADNSIALQEWITGLDEAQQKYLNEIVRSTVQQSVYAFLAIFDNNIGYPIQGQISEFAIYLQTYQEIRDLLRNFPAESVRLNTAHMKGGDDDQLQVLFLERMQEEAI